MKRNRRKRRCVDGTPSRRSDVTKVHSKGGGIDRAGASEGTSTADYEVCHRAGTNELVLGDKVIQVALQHLKEIVANEAWATDYCGRMLTTLILRGAGAGGGWCSIANVLAHALH